MINENENNVLFLYKRNELLCKFKKLFNKLNHNNIIISVFNIKNSKENKDNKDNYILCPKFIIYPF